MNKARLARALFCVYASHKFHRTPAMIDSRDINELHPIVKLKAELFLCKCKAAGLDVVIISTYRDAERQNALYAQGRTKPGPRVTNAKAGQSYHNWRVAFDAVPKRNGAIVWGTTAKADLELWRKMGAIGKSLGFEWGGDWFSLKDYPHFQYTQGLSLSDFQAGKQIDPKKVN